MKQDSKYFYPVTKETLHKYAESIFRPITRGECVTTVWAPMAGRRKHNKFIIENINLFEKELPNYKNYLLVYVEPLELTEESLSGYLRLMAKSFIEVCELHPEYKNILDSNLVEGFDKQDASYSLILDNLRKLLLTTTKTGHEVVFFVGEFDELTFANKIFFNNLKSLWSKLYPKLHYIFLIRERVTRQQNIDNLGELNEAVLQNIVYVPILGSEDVDYMIQRLSSEYSVSPTPDQLETIKDMCGGHPYMIKVAFRALSQLETGRDLKEILTEHYELRSVAQGILSVRSDEEKETLRKIAQHNIADKDSKGIVDFLENMRFIIKKESGGHVLFGKIFENEVLGLEEKKVETGFKESNGNLKYDEDTGAVLFKGKGVEEHFTRQEYSILAMFLEKNDKLCTRDDLGNILWGKESYEKYSDWAIDQLISKLRRKLSSLSVKGKIVTIRGKGYKLIQTT